MLQTIETELVTLSVDRSETKIHSLLRAAHSIKGGAASLGLAAIEDLAHQAENIFRILNHPELPFDRQLERLLFQLYDCLNQLVVYEIERSPVPTDFHTKTQIVLANLDEEIGHFAIAGEYRPNGIIAGIDLTQSIFEVDVAQSLARLERILLDPSGDRLAVGEFRAQSEVFIGIAQLVNLPGFSDLAHATIAALDRHPNRSREICCFALVDFYKALEAVLTDDRANCGKISPGFAFLLAEAPQSPVVSLFAADAEALFDLEQMFERDLAIDPTLIPNRPARLERADFLELSSSCVSGGSIAQMANFAPSLVQRLSVLNDSAAEGLRFDLIDIFDLPSCQQLSILASEDAASLHFDLIDIFDLSQSSSPATVHFDPIDIFDSPNSPVAESSGTNERSTQLSALVASITNNFDRLSPIDPARFAAPPTANAPVRIKKSRPIAITPAPQVSVRVALDRLDRMNNLIGELAIERHGLALSHEQVRDNLQQMRAKCEHFQIIGDRLRQLADTLSIFASTPLPVNRRQQRLASALTEQFDALELDRYSELHGIAQETIEQLAQIEEQIEDLTLFNTQSERQIDRQKQLLSYLRDDLMWARMLPLGEILNRFPRTLHDLSIEYHKPVDLKITGAGVLVDRGTIDKLLDPLLHLLRNAFDHGIDPPAVRQAAGKPQRGAIEIIAYHQGSQTVIEIRDDGGGIDLERIKAKAISLGLLTATDAAIVTDDRLLDFIFSPGFSTSARVTKLSGRGMGLDIVRAQMRTIKGTISIQSQLGRGTTFTLRIPLTLTIAKLMVCQVGNAVYAFPADSIQRIFIPTADRLAHRNDGCCLRWQDTSIPIYHLADLLNYSRPVLETTISQTLKAAVPNPSDWLSPLLIIRTEARLVALQIDRSIAEQELTIKPFGKGITPPSYTYGCTILGDGAILPVIDLHALIRVTIDLPHCPLKKPLLPVSAPVGQSALILVVDDSVTARESLCLSLEKFGYRTLQARDGQEALELLRQKTSELKLAICDVEMPKMNGFEFLNVRRQDSTLAHIPVVMLTSRSNAKHRQFAAHLGAIDYFVKPYIEQDLMAAIGKLIGKQS